MGRIICITVIVLVTLLNIESVHSIVLGVIAGGAAGIYGTLLLQAPHMESARQWLAAIEGWFDELANKLTNQRKSQPGE